MMFKQFITFMILLPTYMISQEFEKSYIDTVYYFNQGTYLDSLSWDKYYPENIFGPPSSKASNQVPASSMTEVLPIGIGGEIIVGIKDKAIFNGPGYDFIIFENAFLNPINKGIFAEPAKVSVSQDGVHFIEFPYDRESLVGLAGISPVIGSKDPFVHPACGGDAFDLDDVGLSFITHIKIVDFTEIIPTLDKTNKYYNPEHLLSGFDLDALSSRYVLDEASVSVNQIPKNDRFHLSQNDDFIRISSQVLDTEFVAKIFDLYGQNLLTMTFIKYVQIPINTISNGIYLIQIMNQTDNVISNMKFIKLR